MSGNLKIKDSTIIQLYSRAEAPCRDYYGLTVTDANILFSTWKISYGPHLHPKCRVVSYEDIKYDKYLQEEIRTTFGYGAFLFIRSLYNNEHKLETLTKNVFFYLMKYLKIKDIFNLAQTSKILKELCNTDNVWKIIYQKYLKRNCYPDELRNAMDIGWKEMAKRKSLLRKKTVNSINTTQKLQDKSKIKLKIPNKPASKQGSAVKLIEHATPRKPITKPTIPNMSAFKPTIPNESTGKHVSAVKLLNSIPDKPVIKKILPNRPIIKQVSNVKNKLSDRSLKIK
ncbi:unnamed protein product [Brassicogethes aeneus]|uniref:F-box domain-containing protein n=1 Tax=Brassicogethes aeneus TaxID=1431903 RepID=A0A9P0FCK3_BRAAE|nr:unnamed protein product [Brassicogethes aeneus]